MKRRALVIGASLRATTGGLRAEELDAERIAALLGGLRFEVDLLRGDGATRAGILAGYRRLIERAEPGDAAVVYFSGHGGMAIAPDAPSDARLLPRRFQFIVPTDYAQTTEDDFRGISAWELSQLLRELTGRTDNVAVILDCCYASQMSRDQAVAGARARALPKLTWLAIGKHYDDVRARFGPIGDPGPMGNPNAVRLVASGDWQTAVQTIDDQGRPAGLMTQMLIATLEEIGEAPVSWRALGDAIRMRVQRKMTTQRPMVEGPVQRRLFSLAEVDTAAIPIASEGDALRLDAGRLAGVTAGDVYGVTRVGAEGFTAEAAIARVRVERVEALRAFARPVDEPLRVPIPPDAVAWPLELALARGAVWIDAPEAERAALEAEVARSARLRVATDRQRIVGELRVCGGELRVVTADGRELDPGARPWSREDAVRQLDHLAAARTLLELEGEHGIADEDVEIEWGTVHGGGERIPRPAHWAALGLGDRIYLRLRNRAEKPRFAHVFNLGLCGRITRLSAYAPGGIRLAPGREELVGPGGLLLSWPRGAPRDEPGIDTLIVIVTPKAADLRALETADPAGARGEARAGGSPLQRLVSQLHEGGTRSAASTDAFCVARRSYVLYPLAAPLAAPAFAIDEDPLALLGAARPDLWIGAAVREPRELEIRLRGLAAQRAVRIDALVCTRATAPSVAYHACTLEVAAGGPARDGDLLWRGPVQDLVDVYLWIGPADAPRGALAERLAAAATRPELAQALEALVVRDPQAPWSLVGGASMALGQAAGALLRATAPETVGLLHTSFVASEGYGLGDQPASGLYRAQGVELGLSIAAAG